MRLALVLVLLVAGCADVRYSETTTQEVYCFKKLPRWEPSIISRPPIQAALSIKKETRDRMIEDVTVYGYEEHVQLHFSLRDASLAALIDVAGGLPKFAENGRQHLGTVRADCHIAGGEGYAYDFRNWRRRDALMLLADVCGRSLIVGPDVNDTIDVEVKGAPPLVMLRLLADEGGVIILEDDRF